MAPSSWWRSVLMGRLWPPPAPITPPGCGKLPLSIVSPLESVASPPPSPRANGTTTRPAWCTGLRARELPDRQATDDAGYDQPGRRNVRWVAGCADWRGCLRRVVARLSVLVEWAQLVPRSMACRRAVADGLELIGAVWML